MPSPTFGDLRSLCQEAPSEAAWRAICQTIDRACEDPALEEQVKDAWLPYASEHLEDWPVALREVPARTLNALNNGALEGPPISFTLAQQITLSGWREDSVAIFDSGHLDDIRAMRFYQIGGDAIAPLFQKHRAILSQLTNLKLDAVFFDEDENKSFIDAVSQGGRLEDFFADGGHPNVWFDAFGESPEAFSSLRKITLRSSNKLTARHFEQWTRPEVLPNLKELDFIYVDLPSKALASAMKASPNLRSVSLYAHGLDNGDIIEVLDNAEVWERLEKLDIGVRGMNARQVKKLGQRLRTRATNLKWFGVHTAFTEYGGGRFPSLKSLGTLPTTIESAKFMYLMSTSPNFETLFEQGYAPREILLADTRDQDGLETALSRMDLRDVESINLRRAPIPATQFERLIATDMPRLREVNFDSCRLGDEGLERLLEASWLPQLETLSLQNNRLTDAHLPKLANILEKSAIRHLDIDTNHQMTLGGIGQLLEAASHHLQPLRVRFSIVEQNAIKRVIPERDSGAPWPAHLVFH